MRRRFRLRRSTDFKRVRRMGKSSAHPLVVLVAASNPMGGLRIGITAGLSVGNAVERNRAKRRLRAAINEQLPGLPTGWDLVFIARKGLLKANFEQVRNSTRRVLDQLGLKVEKQIVHEPES